MCRGCVGYLNEGFPIPPGDQRWVKQNQSNNYDYDILFAVSEKILYQTTTTADVPRVKRTYYITAITRHVSNGDNIDGKSTSKKDGS